jgi:hypothetical protein
MLALSQRGMADQQTAMSLNLQEWHVPKKCCGGDFPTGEGHARGNSCYDSGGFVTVLLVADRQLVSVLDSGLRRSLVAVVPVFG